MFTAEDFKIESAQELIQFLPIVFFIGFIAPFLLAAYGLGFVMDKVGWLD